jgi:prepilin peptidase CpaA
MTDLALSQLLVLLAMLAVAVVTDLRERRIPNIVTIPGLLAGLVIGAFIEGGIPAPALLGAFLAFVVTIPFHALGGLGAGDVKLFTAVGAFVGPGGLLPVLLYGGLAGGVLAIANATRRGAILGLLVNTKNLILHGITGGKAGHPIDLKESEAHSVPYGVAIAAGALLAWFFPLSLGAGL